MERLPFTMLACPEVTDVVQSPLKISTGQDSVELC